MLKIINGDCLKEMNKLIEDGVQVDSLICDPPFNLVEKSGGSIHLFRQSAQDGTDTVTEESMSFDTGFNQTLWIKKACKLLKPGGTVIIFNDWENMGEISKELKDNKINVKSLNFWQKTNPMPCEWKRRFVSGREYFVFGTKKGRTHTFNVEAVHKGIFEMGLTKMSEKKHGKHANQKPLQLMRDIIEIVTNPWDTILDPFLGSGSTAVAAVQTDRSCIGIELDTTYYDLSKVRVNDAITSIQETTQVGEQSGRI